MYDILLVEDQEELAGLIRLFLEQEGFRVFHAASGEDAMEYLANDTAKLVLLDIMLPGMDGFAVCRAIREKWSIPVLIMSARSDKENKLNGYELGADDYVEKPVDMDILSAKIKAHFQRICSPAEKMPVIISGSLTLEPEAHKVYKKGIPIELNAKEYGLLLLFVGNPSKTLHKDYIFNHIWGIDSDSENQTLTVHIKMLRSKIEENPRKPERIQTVWGIGYRYEEI